MIKRLFFEKSGEMQYLSHRDFLRFLERLFKISYCINFDNTWSEENKSVLNKLIEDKL